MTTEHPDHISREVVSLIHHIELSERGWWDKSLERMILHVLAKGPRIPGDIPSQIDSLFGMTAAQITIDSPVQRLIERGDLVELADGRLKITERCLSDVETDKNEFASLEDKVRALFKESLAHEAVPLDPKVVWSDFAAKMLHPLIAELGARTWEMIEGSAHIVKKTSSLQAFLSGFDEDLRDGLQAAVLRFLDPFSIPVRRYVLYHLNAYFLMAASGLHADDLQAIVVSQGRNISIDIVLDTNFVFSVLGLHDNPSNDAAQALIDIAEKTHPNVDVTLGVLSITLEEAKRTVEAAYRRMSDVRWSLPTAKALAATETLSGLAQAYTNHYIETDGRSSPRAYFQDYRDALDSILNARGIEVYGDDVSPIRERTSVRDEIRRRAEDSPKTFEAWEHDVVLWHYVAEARPTDVDSPLEARVWIATIDFGFVDYDQRLKAGGIPTVLHPTQAIQLLEFWTPRSAALERAILHSFRLPFMFYDYDPEAEETTLAILATLSRYESGTDLSEETVRGILTERALRQRVQEANGDKQRIRDLVESEAVEKLAEVTSEQETLETQISEQRKAKESAEQSRDEVEREKQSLREEVSRLRSEVTRLQEQEAADHEAVESAGGRIEELESTVADLQHEKVEGRRRRGRQWLVVQVVLMFLLLTLAVWSVNIYVSDSRLLLVGATLIAFNVWLGVAGFLGRKSSRAHVEDWRLWNVYLGVRQQWVRAGGSVLALIIVLLVEWAASSSSS